MKSPLFITYIILLNLFQGLAFNSSENCTCNEAFNISWTGIRNAIFTPTPDPNGYFCPGLECHWVFYNEITLKQVLLLESNISNNFPFDYQIDNCREALNLLDETLTTAYTQESQICVNLSTVNAISTENIYFKLTFQLLNTRPTLQAFNLSDINSGFSPFQWVQLKPPSSQFQISAYSFLNNSTLYGYIVTEYEHSFNNGLVLVYGSYRSLINYYEYILWNGSSLNGGNDLFYSIYTTNSTSFLSSAISLAYTKGYNQNDVYAFFTIKELFLACHPVYLSTNNLPIQYAYPDNQTFSLTVTRSLSTSLCYGLIVLPSSGRILKFISFDLKQDFTFQVASFGYDSILNYTLFEVDASTAEQYANSFVFAQLIIIMMPEIASITLSLDFEYVSNWNFVHNSTRGVVMSPNYPESGLGQISQFEIQCIVCLENNVEGEFFIKLDDIDFGQFYYIDISSDNVNYTLFYAFNETEGLDFNQTHILNGKTISIEYNTDEGSKDLSRGFLLSYEIRNPGLTSTVTSTIAPNITNAPPNSLRKILLITLVPMFAIVTIIILTVVFLYRRSKLKTNKTIGPDESNNIGRNCYLDLTLSSHHVSNGVFNKNLKKLLDDESVNKLTFSSQEKYDFNMLDLEDSGTIEANTRHLVRKFRHKPSGKMMAVKYLRIPQNRNDEEVMDSQFQMIQREINSFRILSESSQIVDFYGLCVHEGWALLCMELMDLSLRGLYLLVHKEKEDGLFPETIVGCVFVKIINALIFCKSKEIMHRDIKPTNILINYSGEIKLCDFGDSRIVENSMASTQAGTIAYWPPERFTHGFKYDVRGDIWSLGITLMETILGQLPYLKTHQSDPNGAEKFANIESFYILQQKLCNTDFTNIIDDFIRPGYSEDCCETLNLCIQKVETRPKPDQFIRTRFYEQYVNVNLFQIATEISKFKK